MTEPPPDQSPQPLGKRLGRGVAGALTAAVVGAGFGAVAWLLNDPDGRLVGYESLTHYMGQVALGMVITGGLMGWLGRLPKAVGVLVGPPAMLLTTLVYNWQSGPWTVVWMVGCWGGGLLCGALCGLAVRLVGFAR